MIDSHGLNSWVYEGSKHACNRSTCRQGVLHLLLQRSTALYMQCYHTRDRLHATVPRWRAIDLSMQRRWASDAARQRCDRSPGCVT